MALRPYDFNDLSVMLGYEVRVLTYIEKIKNRLYFSYYVPKPDGSRREINTYLHKRVKPNMEIDYVQLRMLDDEDLEKLLEASKTLSQIHKRINSVLFDNIELPPCVHGFVKGESIRNAITPHIGKDYVVALDIHSFFPSVKSDYVLDSLMNFGYGREAAWLVARLVSYKGVLPQGAITSPMASNIAFAPVDFAIMNICTPHGITYTRYADDLVFSANFKLDEQIEQIITVVQNAGYTINRKKIKKYGPKEPHYILGTVANSKINLPREKRRNLEAAIFNFVIKHQLPYGKEPASYKKTLLGQANYMLSMNPSLGRLARLRNELRQFDVDGIQFSNIFIA